MDWVTFQLRHTKHKEKLDDEASKDCEADNRMGGLIIL